MDAAGKWALVLKDHPRIGYLRIVQFSDNTAQEFLAALSEIREGIDGLVIDVRNNPGGLLPEVVKICDYVLPAEKLIVVFWVFLGKMRPLPAKILSCLGFVLLDLVEVCKSRNAAQHPIFPSTFLTRQHAFDDFFIVILARVSQQNIASAGRTRQ